MKTLIVPTDFSPAAVNALNYAADMAIAINAEILIFHAYTIPVALGEVPIALLSVEELKESAEHGVANTRKNLERITAGKVPVKTETRLGNMVDELESLCKDLTPFAVIMGSTGESAIERTLFGSNTLTAIRHLTAPVLCVPQGKEYGLGIQKIGLACDFREVIETTPIPVIRDFIKTFKAKLFVLNVDHDNKQFNADTPAQSGLLHTQLAELKPEYHFIVHKDIEDGINEFAEKNNLDLIIAIPKKHKLLEGLFRKSSTKQLVFEAHVPVMCVHE